MVVSFTICDGQVFPVVLNHRLDEQRLQLALILTSGTTQVSQESQNLFTSRQNVSYGTRITQPAEIL